MAETNPPPKESGGNLKYALIGLLLLLGAVVVGYFVLKSPPPKPKQAKTVQVDAGAQQRPTSLAQPDLVIEVPDAGTDAGPPKKRIVYRYVRSSWECDGNIPAEQAQQVMKDNRRQVRNCYERRLKVNNTLQGSVSVMLRVDHDGKVSGVQVGGSLHDSEVFGCVRRLASSWRFPAPTGGRCAVVSAPFNLTPRP